MQGIFINDKRPRSKKEVKEAPYAFIEIEATSVFGDEYGGALEDMPDGRISFVGPDPYTSRKFYGTIIKQDGKVVIT